MSVMGVTCSKLHYNASSKLHSRYFFALCDNTLMSIRERINEAIARTPGMTYRKVSLRAGLSDSMMHKFMTNSTQSMSIDKLICVADVLGVDPRWLIFGEEIPPSNVVNIWDKISDANKPRALAVLRTFVDEPDITKKKM